MYIQANWKSNIPQVGKHGGCNDMKWELRMFANIGLGKCYIFYITFFLIHCVGSEARYNIQNTFNGILHLIAPLIKTGACTHIQNWKLFHILKYLINAFRKDGVESKIKNQISEPFFINRIHTIKNFSHI